MTKIKLFESILNIKSQAFSKLNFSMLRLPKQLEKDVVQISQHSKVVALAEKTLKSASVIVDSSIELLPGFAKKIPLNAKNIDPESLVLIHMTDFFPKNGKILSAREAMLKNGVGTSRNSVHFTLNHPVQEHRFGSWDGKKYAILAPYNKAVSANQKGLFIEGLADDLYSNGSVKIPEGSVIIKHNPKIEKNKYQISDYEGFPECKIIETSENIHLTTSNVIQQMGYKQSSTSTGLGVFSQGIKDSKDIVNIEANYKGWLEFCDNQGIKPMIHSMSPNNRAEHIIEALDQLATNNRWVVDGDNYKKLMLETISDVKHYSKQGYFVSYDLDKIENIIKKSGSPRKTLKNVEKELGLRPILNRPRKSLFSSNYYGSNLSLYYRHQGIIDKNMQFFMHSPTSDDIAKKIMR